MTVEEIKVSDVVEIGHAEAHGTDPIIRRVEGTEIVNDMLCYTVFSKKGNRFTHYASQVTLATEAQANEFYTIELNNKVFQLYKIKDDSVDCVYVIGGNYGPTLHGPDNMIYHAIKHYDMPVRTVLSVHDIPGL